MIETIGREMRLASMTRVRIAGPDGTPAYLLTMMQDVAERGRAEQRIARLSQHDTLTELPNRGLFADLLSRAVEEARRDGGHDRGARGGPGSLQERQRRARP